jgi:hypothetical protein
MSINLTMLPTEAPAVVYFADGSSVTVDPQQEKYLQLPNGSFCTISSTAKSEEANEAPPTGYAFAEAMVKFWRDMMEKLRDEAQAPQATPL